MCDYSLHGIENRLAVEGEVLVVHRFYTGSKGLTSPSYLEPPKPSRSFLAFLATKFVEPSSICAVCIPDGAKLVLRGISPALQSSHDLCKTEVVTFRQLAADEVTHRDAVEFWNGERIRLQDLEEGEILQVVTVSSQEVEVAELDLPDRSR